MSVLYAVLDQVVDGYLVINDPDPEDPEAPRATAQQDPWHYSIARMAADVLDE